jgi:hypothetical protein
MGNAQQNFHNETVDLIHVSERIEAAWVFLKTHGRTGFEIL